MKCPQCDVALVMSSREGVEIDYCPTCRGVWLDRGELDKIIERSDRFDADEAARRSAPPPPPLPGRRDDDRDRDHYKYHKRKSFWHELFD
jgi:Zn-finger nucleic acid-binding protein